MIRTSDHNGNLQSAIDQALIDADDVYCDKVAPLNKMAVAAVMKDGEYQQVSISIIGDAKMNDNEKRSRIRVTKDFNDQYLIAIQEGKGCDIKGLNIKSNGQGICIAVDPDKAKSRGGSTGITIDNCTTGESEGGIIISPNGHTQNGDLVTVSNHRFGKGEFGFAGCQAQEKLNRILNVRCWDYCKTLFQFRAPGQYKIEDVSVAVGVDELVNRNSTGWFAVTMKNVYAENLQKIGHWYTSVGDSISDSTINFRHPKYNGFPVHMTGAGVRFNNVDLRYNGFENYPVILAADGLKLNDVRGRVLNGWYFPHSKENWITRTNVTETFTHPALKTGDIVIISTLEKNGYAGMAEYTGSGLRYTTTAVMNGEQYNIFKYKSSTQ